LRSRNSIWFDIFRFEIKYHLRQPLFPLTSIVFFLLAFLMIATNAGVVLSHAPDTINRNAPMVIVEMLVMMSILGLFVVTAFVASSVQRDFELGTQMLFFSRSVRKYDYLIGRFAGSMVTILLFFVLAGLGLVAGN